MLTLFRKFLTVLTVGAGLIACAPAFAATTAPGVTAQWQQRQTRFHYSGFTTHYSCDGIKYKVGLLLRTMGARDIKVRDICTSPNGEPQLFHTMKLSFSVPVPAKKGDNKADKKADKKGTFPAEWREVTLAAMNPMDLDSGDCELVEQIRDQVLPLFNPRAVVNRTACIPHQESVGQLYLRMSLLMPVKHKKA